MHVFTCPIITVICMQVSKTTTEHEMLKARITLKNLENLTYNFPNDSTIYCNGIQPKTQPII